MTTQIAIRRATADDIGDISRQHARVFGPGRFTRSAYRVREGKGHLSRFCLVAYEGRNLVASLRMTEVSVGGTSGAVLLGPIAVDPDHRGRGVGTRLIREALEAARTAGIALVILVGDEPYYGRFGFKIAPPGRIAFPGPVNPARLLVREFEPGAVDRLRGVIAAEPARVGTP